MKQPQNSQSQIPMAVRNILQAAASPAFTKEAALFWADPERGATYDAKFSELLSTLPGAAIPGLAEACERYIRAWGSGGGSQKIERCVYDVAVTDYPRVLAINIYRNLQAHDVDKTEAFYLIISIFEDAMGQSILSDAA